MDETIDRLFHIEQSAVATEERLNAEKSTLKQRYDAMKRDYQTQAEQALEEKLSGLREQSEAQEKNKEAAIKEQYEANMAAIERAVASDQMAFSEDFFNGLKALGAETDE